MKKKLNKINKVVPVAIALTLAIIFVVVSCGNSWMLDFLGATKVERMAFTVNGKTITPISATMQPSYEEIGYPAGSFTITTTISAIATVSYTGVGVITIAGTKSATVAPLTAGVA